MRNLIYIFLLLACWSFSQTDKKYPTLAARKSFLTEFCKKYNSKSIQVIWNSDTKNSFEEFVEGHSEYELIEEYGTIIHELYHYYNKRETNGQYYFIESGINVFVPFTQRYNSKELNKHVRKGVQDSVFRYGLYVGGKQYTGIQQGKKVEVNKNGSNELSSITDGIYGMLEEFSAYYYGCLATYEAEKYFQSIQNPNKDPMYDFSQEVMGDVLAYYEFNLFMAWYLSYAKKNHPEIYAEIHKNAAFKVVYTLIDSKFKALVEQATIKCNPHLLDVENEVNDPAFQAFLKLKFDGSFDDLQAYYAVLAQEEPELFTKKQQVVQGKTKTILVPIDEDEADFLLEDYHDLANEMKEYKQVSEQLAIFNSLEFYFALPSKQIEFLKKQFTTEVNNELNKLRIPGLTSANYSTFLK